MGTIPAQKFSKDSSQRQPVRADRKPVAKTRSLSTVSPGSTMLQRKPGCACGGGCPRCQEQRLLQTKLKISEPGDQYEQEADRIADEVMRMPEPSVQRQAEPEEEEEEEVEVKKEQEEGILQTKEASSNIPEVTPDVEASISTLKSGGQPLSDSLRAFFEPRFGYNFSPVRIHTDNQAAEASHVVRARAFTVGQNIVFGSGQYAPETRYGLWLLAHELAHVGQQGAIGRRIQKQPTPQQPTSPCKNQKKVNEQIKKNPRKYASTVTMHTHVIQQGDTLNGLAQATVNHNKVFVVGHYSKEIERLNNGLNTGTIGNCAILLQGWQDPAIGSLPIAAPNANKLPDDVKRAIAVVFAEQTSTTVQGKEHQKYIWYSIRMRLDLGMHGPTIDDVLNKGGYFGKGTSDFKQALTDLTFSKKRPAPTIPGVINARDAVLNNWSSAIPSDAGPFYFHWRRNKTPEKCFNSSTAATPLDKEKECAWNYANSNGFANVPKSQGWHNKIVGDTPPPNDRIGSMYIYPFK